MKKNIILMILIVIGFIGISNSQQNATKHKIIIYESPFYKRFNVEKNRLIKYEFYVNDSIFNSDDFNNDKEKYVKDKKNAHLESLKTKNRYVFEENGLFGIKDNKKVVLTKPVFKKFNKTSQGFFYAFNEKKGCWVLFNKELNQITDCKYSDIYCKDYDNNKCFIEKARKYGTIDTAGKEIIPPVYSQIKFVGEDLLFIVSNNYRDLVTYNNELVFSGKNKKIQDFTCFSKGRGFESFCRFEDNGKQGVLDSTGKIIFKAEYDNIKILDFNNGKNKIRTFFLNKNNKWNIWYNKKMFLEDVDIIHPEFERNYSDFKMEIKSIIYKKQGECGIITNIDKKLSNNSFKKRSFKYIRLKSLEDYRKYKDIGYHYMDYKIQSDNLYYNENDLWGICDITGKVLLKANFENLFYFGSSVFSKYEKQSWDHTSDMYLAMKNHKWGIVDIEGNIIYDYKWDEINMKEFSYFIIVKANGKYGLIDEVGNLFLDTEYDKIKHLMFNSAATYAKIKKDGKWGLVALESEKSIEPDEEIKVLTDEILKNYSDAYSVSIVLKGKKLLECEYDDIKKFEFDKNTYFKLRKDSCWYLMNSNGEMIFDLCSKNIITMDFEKQKYLKVEENDNWNIFTANGKSTSNEKFKSLLKFGNTIYGQNEGGKWGTILTEGKIKHKFIYKDIVKLPIEHPPIKLAKIKLNNKWSILDDKSNFLTKFKFDDIEYLSGDKFYNDNHQYFKVRKNKKWGVLSINKDGKYILKQKVEYIYDSITVDKIFRNYFRVRLGDYWGLYDNGLNQIAKPEYKHILKLSKNKYLFFSDNNNCGEFSKGKFKLLQDKGKKIKIGFNFHKQRKGCLYGLFDSNDSLILDYEYFDIEKFHHKDKNFPYNMAKINKNGLYGYILTDGTFLVKPQFNELRAYQEDMARVMKKDKWGFIDLKGEIVIPLKYDYVEPFTDGKSKVKLNGKTFYIDKKGNSFYE